MTILDALGNAEYRQHVTLLATLMKLSMVDGKIDDKEWEIIRSVALKYGLDDPEGLKYLKKHYEEYSLDTPYSLEERVDQLRDLTRLVWADNRTDPGELKILKRAVLSLGFPSQKADDIFWAALEAVHDGADKKAFRDIILSLVRS